MPVTTRSKFPDEDKEIGLDKKTDAMTEETVAELTLKDLLAAFNKGNAETQQRLINIETSITANQKTVVDYINKNDELVKGLQTKVNTLEATVTNLETTVTTLSDEVSELKKSEKANKKINIKLEKAEKQMDEDRRKSNLIIDGLQENKNEHPAQQVINLMKKIDVTLKPENILTASRLGPLTAQKSRRPRNVILKLSAPCWKQEIFKNIHKAKDSEEWKGIHIQDDLPPEIIEQRRELRCLAALAREKGHRASTRGGALIDEQRYTYKDMENLPEGISMENAKLVEVEDGWAFQGHHAFLSTMHECKITHKGHDFHCTEQVYFYDMADEAGDQRAMQNLRDCENGYSAKRIGFRIKKPEGWTNDKRNEVSAKIQRKKFDQNEPLKRRLVALKGKLYEATRDDFFGVGLTLTQKEHIGKTQQKGLNKLGQTLESLRDEYLGK